MLTTSALKILGIAAIGMLVINYWIPLVAVAICGCAVYMLWRRRSAVFAPAHASSQRTRNIPVNRSPSRLNLNINPTVAWHRDEAAMLRRIRMAARR